MREGPSEKAGLQSDGLKLHSPLVIDERFSRPLVHEVQEANFVDRDRCHLYSRLDCHQ